VASPPDRPRPRPRRSAPSRPGAAPHRAPRPASADLELELTCLPGLTDVVVRELHARLGGGSALRRAPARVVGRPGREDAVALRLPRPSLRAVHELRTLVAVQLVLRYPVPRPKALLGDALRRQMLGDVVAAVADATSVTGARFTALRLEAAGRDSDVMRRLADALAEGVGLPVDEDDGDLVVRARPEADGWALLLRTTPRPLSTRAWRVCDRPGGLNASLAAAMGWLASPPPGARVANPFVGTGTLAIELALADRRAQVAGFDLDPEAIACARRNAEAAGVAARLNLEVSDAVAWPQADASLDLVLADPPWGDAVGSRAGNKTLYPAFLAEAARCLRPGGRLAWVTHEVELTRASLAGPGPWRMLHDRRVWHGGHHPWVMVLERRAGRG